MKKVVLIVLVTALLTVGFFLRPQKPEAQKEVQSPQPSASTSSPAPVPTPNSKPSLPANSAAPTNIPFAARLSQEAAKMDSQKMDFAALEEELEQWALSMDAAEKKIATETIKNKTAPANERVLSAYLLGKAGAWPELLALAKEPFERERAEPHSTGEMNNMRELSIRYMELDFLAEGAKKDKALLNELLRLRSELRDPSLSRHLERRLKELGQ